MTDDQLMADFRDTGSRDAWAELFNRNHLRAYNYVRKACGSEYAGIADEVVSEVFVQMERDRHQYDDSVTGFYPWFYRTMLTTTRDMIRAEKRARRFSNNAEGVDPACDGHGPAGRLEAQEDATNHQAQKNQLQHLVSGLTPVLQSAMQLTHIDRLSLAEAADKAGVSYDTMRKRVANAIKIMRDRAAV